MKKVMVIEDREFKLERVRNALKKIGILNFEHYDNYAQSNSILYDPDYDEAFESLDLIILDMMFYHYGDAYRENREMLATAGCKILYNLADRYGIGDNEETYEKKVSVIVYSEDDWKTKLKDYLIPTFSEYSEYCNRNPQTLCLTYHGMEQQYKKMVEEKQALFDSIDFVYGQAHNKFELETLLKEWANEHK